MRAVHLNGNEEEIRAQHISEYVRRRGFDLNSRVVLSFHVTFIFFFALPSRSVFTLLTHSLSRSVTHSLHFLLDFFFFFYYLSFDCCLFTFWLSIIPIQPMPTWFSSCRFVVLSQNVPKYVRYGHSTYFVTVASNVCILFETK